MVEKPTQPSLSQEDVDKAYHSFKKLLSTQKAREFLSNAETALAFDIEIFLKPIREDLAECVEIIADMIRERGTQGEDLQKLIPVLSDWLNPGKEFSMEIARLEREIAEKKRNHPDFQHAFKLQVLINKYQEQIQDERTNEFEREQIIKQRDQAKRTLNDHIQNKIRIAQRAFAPDMLEIAFSQLALARHHEKVLEIKQELLKTAQGHTQHTLQNIAAIFMDADPELANTILAQTNALMITGDMPSPERPHVPHNLKEYKEELNKQSERIKQFDARLTQCMNQLQELLKFEEAIFETYGEQLRSRGIQFKKTAKIAKTGTAGTTKKQKAARMVRRSEV